jgi:hypothetical protein
MCTNIPVALFVTAAAVTLLSVGAPLLAQTPEKFEVVSVKRSPPANPVTGGFAQITIQPGRFRANNATLRDLVRRAYGSRWAGRCSAGWCTENQVPNVQRSGGPDRNSRSQAGRAGGTFTIGDSGRLRPDRAATCVAHLCDSRLLGSHRHD